MAHRWALLVGVGWRFHGSGDCSGSQVRRDSSTGLISPMSLPSGPATIAHRASQKASNGGCRPARHNGEFGVDVTTRPDAEPAANADYLALPSSWGFS